EGLVGPIPGRNPGFLEPVLQAGFKGCRVGLFVLGGAGVADDGGQRPQLPAGRCNRPDKPNDLHHRSSYHGGSLGFREMLQVDIEDIMVGSPLTTDDAYPRVAGNSSRNAV